MSTRERTTDEERSLMLNFFHKKRDFYTLKQLKILVPKECGLAEQVVQDVLQSLVDVGLVHSDKIGTAVYFWSFLEEKITAMKKDIEKSEQRISILLEKQKQLKREIEESQKDHEKIKAPMKEMGALKASDENFKGQLGKCSVAEERDAIARINENAKAMKERANTWTDNIFFVKAWSREKFNVDEAKLNEQFEIPEDLDYL